MYVDAIIERGKGSEKLIVAERVDGKRVLKEIDPVYEYYVESQYGTQKTIHGTKAEKFEFSNRKDMNNSLLKHKGLRTYESNRNVVFKTLRRYYEGVESPNLNVLFFDIETDFHKKFGYAPPQNPFNRVTAISFYQSWTGKDYVYTLPPDGMDQLTATNIIKEINEETNDENSIVVLYNDEREMFLDFFEEMEDADVLSGWNSEFFDIPYMVNRTEKLFNASMTTRWCLWGKKPRKREADNYGKIVEVYDLIGRIHMDYLALYKKHAGQVEQSYSLEFIGRKVTGEGKVPYNGSLDTLYKNDYKSFIQYSKQDSILLKNIDKKMDFISLHNRLAHNESVLISTTMGTVALVDTAIINLLHSRGEVMFDKPKEENSDIEDTSVKDYTYGPSESDEDEDVYEKLEAKAAGAWVQDPILGLVDYIGCTDFNSLYPTILRTLGMSTELILGQIRQDYTDAYLAEQISNQRSKYRGKKFEPDWTAAWHGKFSSIEFELLHAKTDDILTIDLENGDTFTMTAKELHEVIFAPDSTIVVSANGTLFDKTRYGVIPEILTNWYTERKAQQKMVLDFKHLYTDGWDLGIDSNLLKDELDKVGYGNVKRRLRQVNLHEECPIFQLRKSLSNISEVANIIVENGLIFDGKKVWVSEEDKEYCKNQSAFWKQNQQIRKILLNSLYGALLNVASSFYDKRLGQSVTLTGRTMTKHMAAEINNICTGVYSESGGVVVYGDSVIGTSMIDVVIDGEEKSISIEDLYNAFSKTSYVDKIDKEYVNTNILVKTFNIKDRIAYYDNAKSIMRHKNKNSRYEIKTDNHKCTVTSDHSVIAEVDGEIGEFTPLEIKELIDDGCDVYLIISE